MNTFDIEILDDTEPEDEAVYVRLTGLRLITAAQIRPGNLTFNQSHQTVNTFDNEILDDTEPEEDEAVYVRLTGL